jgi:hypothetical protein
MLKNLVNVQKLVEMLKGLKDFCVTGDVDEIKVIEDITVTEDNNIITISGINDEFEEDYFVINANEISYYEEDEIDGCKGFDFFMRDSRLICTEGWEK